MLSSPDHDIRTISFDHDLGEDDTTGPVALWIEKRAYLGVGHRIAWNIHSANPVGRQWLIRALTACERFWDEHNK